MYKLGHRLLNIPSITSEEEFLSVENPKISSPQNTDVNSNSGVSTFREKKDKKSKFLNSRYLAIEWPTYVPTIVP